MRRLVAAVVLGVGPLSLALLPPVADAGRPGSQAVAPAGAVRPEPQRAAEDDGYQDPPSYDGPARAPRVKPIVGPKAVLSPTGEDPDVYVDEAGTAHVVWNEGRGDGADEAVYCRLQRAATACDTSTVLRWDKAYDTGDGPQYNVDNPGPRIVRIGNTLVVLSFRYPTMGVKPDGASSSTLIGWVSNDGGDTWDAAEVLGKRSLGELVVVGPDNDPVILSLAYDPFCNLEGTAAMCLTQIRSGVYETETGVLSPAPGANYSPSLTRHEGAAVAAMADGGVGSTDGTWSFWLRRWNGAEPATDPANWSTSAPIPGDDPDVAGGPRGLHLLAFAWDERGWVGDLQVRRVALGADGAADLTAPIVLADSRARDPELAQDSSGGLHVAYEHAGTILLRTTMPEAELAPRPAFLPAAVLGTTDDVVDPVALSVTADGGGFVVHDSVDGVRAVGIGSQAPTGLPGVADLPGGGNISCKHVDFGQFQVETVNGCFFRGTGANADQVVTRGAIRLNGLEIVPTAGSQLVIDAAKLRIDTIGTARVLVRNAEAEILLFEGPIHRDLAGLGIGDRLFEFPREEFQADILGFPAASGLPTEMTEYGVRIPFEVELPEEFLGFTGKGTLRAETGPGLVLDSLEIKVGPLNLGVLEIEAALEWEEGGTWTGEGKLGVTGFGAIDVEVGFVDGGFDHAEAGYEPDPAIPIGKFVYLTRIGGGLDVDPDVRIDLEGTIAAGAKIKDVWPVEAEGTASMIFPSDGPASFGLEGELKLLGFDLAESEFRFRTDGHATYEGKIELELGPVSGGVTAEGFVDGFAGRFGARFFGGSKVCVLEVDPSGQNPPQEVCSATGLNMATSDVGVAACGEVLGESAGIELRWADLTPAVLANQALLLIEMIEAFTIPCSTSAFYLPPPARTHRALRAGGAAFAVPDGLPTSTIRVDSGTGAVPDVVVTAPDGTQVVGPGATGEDTEVVTFEGSGRLWVMTGDPQGGVWTVEPAAGEPALGEVALSEGYLPGTVTGSVREELRDGKVVVTYRTRRIGGPQTVELRETGAFGTRVIGEVAASRPGRAATYAFRPARGRGGVRTVEAVVQHDGVDQRVVELGTFRAPPPQPPPPVGRVRAEKNGSRVVVTWRSPQRAERIEVQATGSAGSAVARQVGGKVERLVLDGWKWDRRVTVRVRAWSADGLRSGWRSARIPS